MVPVDRGAVWKLEGQAQRCEKSTYYRFSKRLGIGCVGGKGKGIVKIGNTRSGFEVGC